MEIQIKRAIKAGNSSAVILPRAWLNKEVRIELAKKSDEDILIDTLIILGDSFRTETIIGVYLVGSYARGEEGPDSDIDVLVVTQGIDAGLINEGAYNILVVSSALLASKLHKDLLPIGAMLIEAKPLLNCNYLSSFKVKATKENTKWHITTTENKLRIIKQVIEWARSRSIRHLSDRIAYTLVLRIRTLHMLRAILNGSRYSKKDFVRLIGKTSRGRNAYAGYLNIKNNNSETSSVSVDEVERLYTYLKEQLENVKKDLH